MKTALQKIEWLKGERSIGRFRCQNEGEDQDLSTLLNQIEISLKKKTPAKPQQFYAKEIVDNTGAKYLSQYQEFVNLLLGGDIPSEGILKIKKQLKYNDFEKVLLKASSKGKRLSDLVSAMANSDKYTRGKKSLFLTLNNWLNRD